MLPAKREQILKSLVRVGSPGNSQGMGVFTPAGHVLTAAHCLPKQPDPEKHALLLNGTADPVRVPCYAFGNNEVMFEFQAVSADRCIDLAVLGKQEPSNYSDWKPFTEAVESCRLQLDVQSKDKVIPVHICTHKNEWLTGRWRTTGPINWDGGPPPDVDSDPPPDADDDPLPEPLAFIQLNPEDRVRRGTSGAPVFDEEGGVLGIINKAYEVSPVAQMALLSTALPRWVQLWESREQKSP
jgi:hypothetical protein